MWVTKGLLYTYCIGQAPREKQKERKTCCLFRGPNALFWGVGGGVDPSWLLQKNWQPDASMLLALENKRQHFEEDHCVTPKLIAAWGDYHVLVLFGISQTKKLSLSHYTRVYVTNTSARFFFVFMQTHHSRRKKGQVIDWSKHPLLLLSYLANVWA